MSVTAESLQALYDQLVSEPVRPRMVYFACTHCKTVGMCPDPGILKCPKCGNRTILGDALNADEWDDVNV